MSFSLTDIRSFLKNSQNMISTLVNWSQHMTKLLSEWSIVYYSKWSVANLYLKRFVTYDCTTVVKEFPTVLVMLHSWFHKAPWLLFNTKMSKFFGYIIARKSRIWCSWDVRFVLDQLGMYSANSLKQQYVGALSSFAS